ncbi:MAG: hypothetical protein WC860_05410 [Candidatus Margulisiibacteriota bacterium]
MTLPNIDPNSTLGKQRTAKLQERQAANQAQRQNVAQQLPPAQLFVLGAILPLPAIAPHVPPRG